MPRSKYEKIIRDDVVAHIREHHPDARVIHENNVSGTGSNRADVIAVGPAYIVAFEIKSEKGTLKRLPKQTQAMTRLTPYSYAVLHEKHTPVVEQVYGTGIKRTRKILKMPESVSEYSVLVWPLKNRLGPGEYDFHKKWAVAMTRDGIALPSNALGILWAEELRELCKGYGIETSKRPTMVETYNALKWRCTGQQITEGVCRMLRKRECFEADPPIEEPCGK